MKRAYKRSLATAEAASNLLPEAPFLPTKALLGEMAEKHLINARQLFGTSAGAPGPRPDQEISGSEWMMRREKSLKFANERADSVLEAMEE